MERIKKKGQGSGRERKTRKGLSATPTATDNSSVGCFCLVCFVCTFALLVCVCLFTCLFCLLSFFFPFFSLLHGGGTEEWIKRRKIE